jgi:asparagine synthase (glutamine-hydrolysing)
MCGIAGYFAADGIGRDEGNDLISRMLAALAHRGPDGEGRFVDPQCGLGNTRLAIIDVANGRMPVSNEDGQIVGVMNGELYNYRDIRKGLLSRGHRLINQSDSEVLPHLYEEAGPEIAPKLTGMFAFAVWDRRERRLLLARDRFGIKPLLLARAGGLLLFASEAKALLASGRLEPRIDPRALRDLGTAGYPMPPRTMFRGVEYLLPGCWQSFGPGAAGKPRRYFSVPYPGPAGVAEREGAVPGAEAADRMRALFDEVVRDHLVADVPVGSYVSGGIDSVSVAMRASAQKAGPLSTFSMTFPGAEAGFDESEFSDLAARTMGSRHLRVPQGAIDEADYRGTIRATEAPQLYTAAFCQYRLARAVRQAGIKVVLSGQGADETLAGYRAFKTARMRRSLPGRHIFWRRLGVGPWLRRRDPDFYGALLSWWKAEPVLEERYGLVPPWSGQWALLAGAWNALFDPAASSALFADPSEAETLPEPPPDLVAGRVRDPLHRDLLFEQRSRLEGWVLALEDRVSMAHSVEERVPFLDHRLVELTAAVPSSLLLHGFKEKHLLREAMTGQVPESLRRRKKKAFDPPVEGWLFGEIRPPFVEAALSPDALKRVGLFTPRGIAALSERMADGRPGFSRMGASWALNLALGIQIFAEEFAASL